MSRISSILAALLTAGLVVGCGEGIDGLELAPTDDGIFLGGRIAWADGVLMVELHGRPGVVDPDRNPIARVEAFDADGRPLMDASLHLWDAWGDDARPKVTFYFVDTRPAEVVVRVDDDDLSDRLTLRAVREVPVVAAGGACDPVGVENRCALGSTCTVPDGIYSISQPGNSRPVPSARTGLGWCAAVEARAFRGLADDGQTTLAQVDIRPAVDLPYYRTNAIGPDRRWLGRRAHFDLAHDAPRGYLSLALPGNDLAGPIAVHLGPHAAVHVDRLEAPAERAVDQRCDPLKITDRCAADTLCVDAVCVPATAPVIENAEARAIGNSIELRFDAVDAEGDIVDFDVWGLGDVQPQRFTWSWAEPVRQWHLGQPALTADLVREGNTWTGLLRATATIRGADRAPYAAVRLQVRDALGFVTTVEVPTTPAAPVEVGDAQICDPHGIDSVCADGITCEAADGDPEPRCHTDAARPVCADAPVLVDALDGAWTGDEARSHFTCLAGYAADERILPVRHYAFVAPAAGRYEFVLGGNRVGLAVRTACDLPSTERVAHWGGPACAEGRYPIVRIDLEAGQQVYVVAAGWTEALNWPHQYADDDAYRLTVTRLEDDRR